MAKETTGPNKVALRRKGKLVVMVGVVQRFYSTALSHYIQVKDTTSSTGASHQLQLCPDLTDESISLELVESTDDQQGELLRATVEEECHHEDAATSDTASSTGASHQLQLCPDLTDESITLELVESTDDQQGELLHATMEEEMHEDAATSCSSTSAERLPSLLHHAVGPSARVCFFGGFDTVSLTPGAVRDLCGVCDNVFAMLLGLLPEVRDKTTDVSLPNKLLIFLFKMKHGLPFSAIAVLFGIHETTVSRIFHAVLGTLATATRKWIYKPQMHVIKDTRPECFKLNYPECTVIVDCTEVRTETPSEVRQQHVLFSTYKNGFTLKFLVAIAPSGFIVFKSKSYGGRCSDTQIVLESGFLDIICQNDVILADKGFPGILAGVVGKSAVLIMPPFSTGSQPFTPQELKQTYNVAQVRVHVERVIQRIKIHGILVNRVPISLIPAMSDIFHMCCVLANLQSSIIQSGGK
ncbi:uncharacterized protein LOC119372547 isoform X3 [Rhipicephalus sanguineus]|uniref:uncharacterized protein LOC119372547 isoform X3 n=1 Tax=Rhipicephalus sanguineus TaxID=34632 RepID=UPI0020C2FAF7|nr:uncharacterized protein LOC119372547 isoform X3 [Rhipicephalus sanguineus]